MITYFKYNSGVTPISRGVKRAISPLLILLLAPLCIPGSSQAAASAKPNVILILVDDLGFSDLGCYGGEIATPNLDRLAADGLRFTQFYNTAKCHSSRVSLLSGRWCQQAGDSQFSRAVIIPEVLAPAGYFSFMTGKWHLDKQPTDFGFQRYFGHLSGATPYYRGNDSFRLNGQRWPVPDKGFYTTIANVDYALKFLDEARETKQPWFLYLAFNAPHAPLQPLEADYKKYLCQYDSGWDKVRDARFVKQQQLGLFGQDVAPSPRPEHVPAWAELSPETQQWESRRMAAYAGLIDRVDQELGRLFADLKAQGEFDNTLILFFSDNGACPYDRRSIGRELEPYAPGASWSDSTGWAWARNSPFRYYKQNQFEGGIATPAIAHWPAGLKTQPGVLVDTPSHLVDVLPTLVEITGAELPASWPDRELSPLPGISLAPIFAGQKIDSRPPIHFLFSRDRGLRDGDWKLVSFQSSPWELYNLATDRTEIHNVAAQHPDIVARMVTRWTDIAKNDLRAPAKDYVPVAATSDLPHLHREWTDYSSAAASSARHDTTKRNNQKMREDRAGQEKLEGKPAEVNPSKSRPDRASGARDIRARISTKLSIENDQLILQCEGNDSGLAFDRLPQLPAGPYTLEFRLQSHAGGEGEIYWTTDAKTPLPRGGHQTFQVKHDGQWQPVILKIAETSPLHALRLDPCSEPGRVVIESLQLKDSAGNVLKSWP